MQNLILKTKNFISKNPNENEIESFYVNEILPYSKNSISELLEM